MVHLASTDSDLLEDVMGTRIAELLDGINGRSRALVTMEGANEGAHAHGDG